MSSRCKVCNTLKVTSTDQINNDDRWKCKTCGNLLDAKGHVITSWLYLKVRLYYRRTKIIY